jgi:RNA polymerase sigma-70 factor, ECF subfamily
VGPNQIDTARLGEDFATFYTDTYKWAVSRLAPLMGVSYSMAEDAVQDAFIACRDRWPGLRSDTRSVRQQYLLKAARNSILEHHRKHGRVSCWGSQADMDTVSAVAADRTQAITDRLAVMECLKRLTKPQRQALLAVHYLGMTLDQTADLLGMSQSTVRTHLKRARDKLRKELDAAGKPGTSGTRRNSLRRKA